MVDGVEANKKPVARKPVQKKVTIKPKPEEIIEISPDSDVVEKEKPIITKENGVEKSSKKRAPTLTSTLSARSKVGSVYILW